MIKLGGGYINEDYIEAIVPSLDGGKYVVMLTSGKAIVSASEEEVRSALESVGLLLDHESIYVDLSENDRYWMENALVKGYRYIARDKTQQVFAYKEKPRKGQAEWGSDGDAMRIKGEYPFLSFEDDEPVKIAALLGIGVES